MATAAASRRASVFLVYDGQYERVEQPSPLPPSQQHIDEQHIDEQQIHASLHDQHLDVRYRRRCGELQVSVEGNEWRPFRADLASLRARRVRFPTDYCDEWDSSAELREFHFGNSLKTIYMLNKLGGAQHIEDGSLTQFRVSAKKNAFSEALQCMRDKKK